MGRALRRRSDEKVALCTCATAGVVFGRCSFISSTLLPYLRRGGHCGPAHAANARGGGGRYTFYRRLSLRATCGNHAVSRAKERISIRLLARGGRGPHFKRHNSLSGQAENRGRGLRASQLRSLGERKPITKRTACVCGRRIPILGTPNEQRIYRDSGSQRRFSIGRFNRRRQPDRAESTNHYRPAPAPYSGAGYCGAAWIRQPGIAAKSQRSVSRPLRPQIIHLTEYMADLLC